MSYTDYLAHREADPRINAPVCISHLPPEMRLQAMIDRDKQRRADYMATYRNPKTTIWQRLRERLKPAERVANCGRVAE